MEKQVKNIKNNEILTVAERLTTTHFWDSCYRERKTIPFDDRDWTNYGAIQLVRLIESLDLNGKSICEVGGGDAQIICYLAKKYPTSKFSVIDFSALGCDLARRRAMQEKVNLDVYQSDFFTPPQEALGKFDLVISLGVVEHFTELFKALQAKNQLANNEGKLFTWIPNFHSPLYSALCKRWSISVYEDHVPHNLQSFHEGHEKAGLKVVKSGYAGAMEFGMLSMAMNGPEKKNKFDRELYLWLTRLSKLVHFVEYKTFDFPATNLLSPFMYTISEKAG